MITLATSSVVIYTLTISVLFLTVLILALLTVLKIPVPVRGFFAFPFVSSEQRSRILRAI